MALSPQAYPGGAARPGRALALKLARRCLALLLTLAGMAAYALGPEEGERSIASWLQRLHDASRQSAYTGTVVVSSAEGSMSSARVWHACDAGRQMERVESLTGTPRTTFRRNDEVITFLPQTHVAVMERRESMSLFPQLLGSVDVPFDRYYQVAGRTADRVAGVDADVVQLSPRDALRYGYRIWSEKKSGLVVKMQTLDNQGHVLEQVAFSELNFDDPLSAEKLSRMMDDTRGYRVESPLQTRTTPEAEGWHLAHEVPGFRPVGCYRRAAESTQTTVQWVFSDGLATVSLFIEPLDLHPRKAASHQGLGATHALSQGLQGASSSWWLTAVGEVPAQTLQRFAQELERLR